MQTPASKVSFIPTEAQYRRFQPDYHLEKSGTYQGQTLQHEAAVRHPADMPMMSTSALSPLYPRYWPQNGKGGKRKDPATGHRNLPELQKTLENTQNCSRKVANVDRGRCLCCEKQPNLWFLGAMPGLLPRDQVVLYVLQPSELLFQQ